VNAGSLVIVLIWVIAAVSTLWPATPEPPGSNGSHAVTALPSSHQILDRYEDTLHTLKAPALMSFAYSIEQAGLRNIEQVHRVYRQGLLERDELLSVSGRRSSHPVVYIARDRPDHYAIANLAPTRAHYDFVLIGALRFCFDRDEARRERETGRFCVSHDSEDRRRLCRNLGDDRRKLSATPRDHVSRGCRRSARRGACRVRPRRSLLGSHCGERDSAVG
jgi:hypothetical protein